MAEGTAQQMNAAFGVMLNRYRAPERKVPPHPPRKKGEGRPFGDHLQMGAHEYRGFEGRVHLPANFGRNWWNAVIGLDNRKVGRPAGAGTGDPPGAAYLTPLQIAQDYNFPTNSAAGQTIGIFEDASAGAAYLRSDVNSYVVALGVCRHRLSPTFFFWATPTTDRWWSNPAPGAILECNIDVCIAATSGQGANINVYFTDDSNWDGTRSLIAQRSRWRATIHLRS